MIEFSAVIQEILVNAEATTMHLDISMLDVSPLTVLIDQEVAVTISPSKESKPIKRTPTHKGATPSCE